MINWFGPASWDAPICSDAPRCDIPLGAICARCAVAITAADHGVTMPGLDAAGRLAPATYHLPCHLKSVLPHWLWPKAGLIPDAADGLDAGGVFACATCGMTYDPGSGWMRRIV